jgi:DNA-binding FadR family transcriptional regulator
VHAIVHVACGNPLLIDLLRNLYDGLMVYSHAQMPQQVDSAALTEEHEGLLRAIAARDADRAEAEMRAHIRSALRVWL